MQFFEIMIRMFPKTNCEVASFIMFDGGGFYGLVQILCQS